MFLRPLTLCALVASALLWQPQATAATQLRDEMTAAEFQAAGLDKLTPGELAALEAWLDAREAPEAPPAPQEAPVAPPPQVPTPEQAFGSEDVPKPKVKAGEPAQPEDLDRIEAHYVGEFRGWDGYTRFPLDNGQVWMQSEPGKFRIRARENPKVTIVRGLFGAYYLTVEGYGKRIKVTRIK